MSPADLATRQDLAPITAQLKAVLALLEQSAAPAAAELLTLDDVAAYTKLDRRTVKKWTTEGRYNGQGKRVYLTAYEFNGMLRFKQADVDAFGLGTGVLEPSQVGNARPEPARKTRKSKKPLASEDALRRVA